MPDLILYGLPPSSYVRTAMMVCEAKGVDYTLTPVDFRDPAYKTTHHPFGKMPTLQHGDLHLYETLAIGTYVDEAFDGPALQPADPAGRARMLQWISAINDCGYQRIVRDCVQERFVKPMRGLEPDEDHIKAALPGIAEVLGTLEGSVQGTPYLSSQDMTLADLFLAPILHYFAATPEGGQMLPERQGLQAWMERIAGAPGYARINALG